MFQWIKITYTRNKTVLFLFVVSFVNMMSNSFENFVLEHIALIAETSAEHSEYNSTAYSCHPLRDYKQPYVSGVKTKFYWTQEQKDVAKIIQFLSPVCGILYAGILSDRYGGHYVLVVGFIIGALVMWSLYLSILHNNYIFLAMLAVRRNSEGIVKAALFSLAGKLAKPEIRTTFVSVILIGAFCGRFLGFVISRIIDDWTHICCISGFVTVVTSIWWWMVSQRPQFPNVYRVKYVPWQQIMCSVSIYVLVLLHFSCSLLHVTAFTNFKFYFEKILFLQMEDWLTELMIHLTPVVGFVFCAASSDYIIFREILPVLTLRKYFYFCSVVIFFFTFLVVKLAECNLIMVLGCWIVLCYAGTLALCTYLTTILDLAPNLSGTILGVIIVLAVLPCFGLHSLMNGVFVSDDFKGDINNWSKLFFVTEFLGFMFATPFIFYEIRKRKKRLYQTSKSVHWEDQDNFEMKSKNTEINFSHDSNPGPSNR